MDKTALVDRYVEDGRRLVEALDRHNFPVTAAFWFYMPDSDEWRLLIASPVAEEKGPKGAYEDVQSVLSELNPPLEMALSDVSAISPTHELVRLLGQAIVTGPGISGIRFTRNTVNGVFIEDAYIYRLSLPVRR